MPIVVAINKVDRPESDPERVKRQLAERDLLIEEWGGDVVAVPVSALTGAGVQDLLDNLAVVSEISELKANPHRAARGVVVEARIDRTRGTVATALIQSGTLKVGDNVVVGSLRGRVRAMIADGGQHISSATPSQPVEILGISGVPEAGDILEATPDERAARQLSERRERESQLQRAAGPTLEDVHTRIAAGEVKALNLIIKTDVQGSVDAVKSALTNLSTEQARVNIVHLASGAITESDVLLGMASQAIIVGFNSEPEQGARALANQEGVEIRRYDIIYNLLEDVERALTGLAGAGVRGCAGGQRHGSGDIRRGQAHDGGGVLCERRADNARVHHKRAARRQAHTRGPCGEPKALQGRCARGERGL